MACKKIIISFLSIMFSSVVAFVCLETSWYNRSICLTLCFMVLNVLILVITAIILLREVYLWILLEIHLQPCVSNNKEPSWPLVCVIILSSPHILQGEEGAILEDEPVINKGIGQALNVAVNKGFLEIEKIKMQKMSKQMLEMKAQNYSIEDKRYE